MDDYINYIKLDYKYGNCFPEIDKDSFEKYGKSTSWFFPPTDLNQIRRLDHISLLSLNDDERDAFIKKIIEDYVNDLRDYGLNYKDYIFNRFYFKDFHIRENVRNSKNPDIKLVRYYHFTISDFGDHRKEFDDRILAITIYTSNGHVITVDGSWQIFVSHIPALIANLMISNNFLNEIGLDENIPLFMVECEAKNKMDYILDSGGKLNCNAGYIKYSKNNLEKSIIESLKIANIDVDDSLMKAKIRRFYNNIIESVLRFAAFNYYMLNKVEEEQEVSMDNFETSGTIVECVKSKAYMDKKIRINLDRDYDIKLNVNPKRRNIYSHDNKIIRRLCDYKFQVCAHWHYYWYGPRNQPELRHKERRWVEAYYKNEDKDFNIIKERYKEKV